jgi:hypothetical protein
LTPSDVLAGRSRATKDEEAERRSGVKKLISEATEELAEVSKTVTHQLPLDGWAVNEGIVVEVP